MPSRSSCGCSRPEPVNRRLERESRCVVIRTRATFALNAAGSFSVRYAPANSDFATVSLNWRLATTDPSHAVT